MRDGDALVVDERRVGDIAAVHRGGFENRTDARVAAERHHGIFGAGHGVSGLLVDDPAQQLAAPPTIFQTDAPETGQVQRAEHNHRQRNQRGDRRGLLCGEADTHAGYPEARFRSASSRNRLSLLWRVLTVTPRISAARVLLSCV